MSLFDQGLALEDGGVRWYHLGGHDWVRIWGQVESDEWVRFRPSCVELGEWSHLANGCGIQVLL